MINRQRQVALYSNSLRHAAYLPWSIGANSQQRCPGVERPTPRFIVHHVSCPSAPTPSLPQYHVLRRRSPHHSSASRSMKMIQPRSLPLHMPGTLVPKASISNPAFQYRTANSEQAKPFTGSTLLSRQVFRSSLISDVNDKVKYFSDHDLK